MSALPAAAPSLSQVPATFHALHAALRADVARLADVADAAARGDAGVVPALVDRIDVFVEMLHIHSGCEDELIVPDVLARRAGAAPCVAVMEAQHAQLDTLAYRVRDRAAVLDPESRGWRVVALAVAEDLDALAEALSTHLDDEERDLLPQWCAAFTQTEQDALAVALRRQVGERLALLMGWLAHVLGDEAVMTLVDTQSAEPAALPADWRTAFAERPGAAL